jgi:hypothetical protein
MKRDREIPPRLFQIAFSRIGAPAGGVAEFRRDRRLYRGGPELLFSNHEELSEEAESGWHTRVNVGSGRMAR